MTQTKKNSNHSELLRNNKNALFFDFDGVLVDSVEVKTRAFARLFSQYGPAVEEKVIDHHRKNGGMTRIEKFRWYYKEFLGKPISQHEMDDLCKKFAQLVIDEVVVAPEILGATDFLEKCVPKIPCFLISATPEEEIHLIVSRRGIHSFFEEIRGAPTKKSENLSQLLQKFSLDPDRCIFFGDAETDFLAAQRCHVRFIGVLPNSEAPLLKVAPGIEWFKNFLEIQHSLSSPIFEG
ncbi:MAG: HAD family hydrolase [Candidatus Riflebacteria bacterium]|nr:HAD family hydrolase [Candidatus Riflebacteria bacterium]